MNGKVDPVEEFTQEVDDLLAPILMKYGLTRAVAHQVVGEAADALIPFVVQVRDGTLAEAEGVVGESKTLAEASIRINHRRSDRTF